MPTDAGNLVARVVRTGLATFDPSGELAGRGLALRCINAVPHSRGLGSSAAAIVGGLALAAQLAGVVGPDGVSAEQLVALATRLEGHPDNAAAAVLGGATIAWTHESALGPVGQAVRIDVDPRIRPVVAIPVSQASTAGARGALPSAVPHADAAFNVARAALLSHALSHDPSLLLEATDDRLHQRQRRSVYPESLELVGSLRKRGIAAAISGAGPTVIVLGSDDAGEIARNIGDLAGPSWRVLALRVAGDGVRGRVIPRAAGETVGGSTPGIGWSGVHRPANEGANVVGGPARRPSRATASAVAAGTLPATAVRVPSRDWCRLGCATTHPGGQHP